MTDQPGIQREIASTLDVILGAFEHVRLDDEDGRRWLAERLAAELLDDFEVRRREP